MHFMHKPTTTKRQINEKTVHVSFFFVTLAFDLHIVSHPTEKAFVNGGYRYIGIEYAY